MCGIIGFLGGGPQPADALAATGAAMAASIAHRGPDHQGVWAEPSIPLVLGYRRLAIQDLSAAGTQPMTARSGRHVMVFNGEIYNFHELRRGLAEAGAGFHGHSDTEVLLEAIDHWGLDEALDRASGMFAFAVWDKETRRLTLARDRFGKKPLYYGRFGGTLMFGSELKALAAHPAFAGTIDRGALRQLLRFGWLPGPASIFAEVGKLPPGTTLSLPAPLPADLPAPVTFWSAAAAASAAAAEPFEGNFEAAVGELDRLLSEAVRQRMIADVDLGALLSGGVDSATVVGLMQAQSERPVRTFSIGFAEPRYDEAPHAAAVARHLGTDHRELYIGPDDLLACVPELPQIFDEPFADPSAVPTALVARLARGSVKVALTGDGGDEVFGGYKRYRRCLEDWRRWGAWPWPLRRTLAGALVALEDRVWQGLSPPEGGTAAEIGKWARLPAKLAAKHARLAARTREDLFGIVRTHGNPVDALVLGAPPVSVREPLIGDAGGLADPLRAMMLRDVTSYLPDNNLTKVDRASMAVGLELRSPLLDRRVADFVWRLPSGFLMDAAGGKRVLRGVLARYVPPELTDRPKRGFGVPIGAWLRGPLREWAEALLDPRALAEGGLLDPGAVRDLWRQHLTGWRDRKEVLWSLLMFQAWWQTWTDAAGSSADHAEAAAIPVSEPSRISS